MEKIVKIAFVIVAAVVLLISVIKFTYIGDGKITPGVYKVKDFDRYPDACIEVRDDEIQFYNIDLNAIYQDEMLKNYYDLIEKKPEFALSDEDVKKYSDLNTLMVMNPYPVDFEMQDEDDKTGTFTYFYNFYTKLIFGFGMYYDSLHKTLQIEHYFQELTFKK